MTDTPDTPPAPRRKCVALAGNPNVGKSTLFNRLTGARQKIANYPGVTVEKKTGVFRAPNGEEVELIDLPGAYSLEAASEDEAVAASCLLGRMEDVALPDAVLVMIEAARLDRGLLLFRQIQRAHPQAILVLNMADELVQEGFVIDVKKLSDLVGAPVVSISARTGEGVAALETLIGNLETFTSGTIPVAPPQNMILGGSEEFERIDAIVAAVLSKSSRRRDDFTERCDAILLHPIAGPLIFLIVIFAVFQALFTGSAPLMDFVERGIAFVSEKVCDSITTPWLKSLVGDGIFAGVGGVLVFVPQIAVAFILIGFLEMTGYLARGAFLMDRLMRSVGLEGRAFIPLISSFACAVPGVMSARTVPDSRQRLMTILIAPLMTCSARLPVYTLLIASFVPDARVLGVVNAQGLVLFALFVLGIAAAFFVSFLLDRFLPGRGRGGFFIELPKYRLPTMKNLYYYVSSRTGSFVKKAGTTIFLLSIVLWLCAYFPRDVKVAASYERQVQEVDALSLDDAQKDALLTKIANESAGEQLRGSFMGRLGRMMEPALVPMGFDWRLGVGLIASFAAREVFVSTMGVVFNLGEADENSQSLRQLLQTARNADGTPSYTLRTALSLLAFFALAAQCMSTLAVIARETNSRKWAVFVFVYMSVLAYAASTLTYQGLGWLGVS